MCETENNIKFSWLLVSQFVSWDFCRYMCEKSENRSFEPDVLTFLRNMVVERTEKAATDVTQHEIIARFLMEVKTIRTLTRMPLIHKLSKNVIEKCPELETCVTELLRKLKWLLETLEEDRYPGMREEILSRISCEVNKFNKEACKKLPLPKLLQVIQTWLQLQFQAQILEVKLRNVENVPLYEKVVDCLRKEKLTSEEVKTIARTLYEDKKLKKLILNFETEAETDSQSQSQSTASFQVFQQHSFPDESLRPSSPVKFSNPMPEINPANVTQAFTVEPDYSPPVPNNQKQKVSSDESFNPSSPEEVIEPVEQYKKDGGAQDLGVLNPTKSYSFQPSGSQLKVQKETSHKQASCFNPSCSSSSDSSDIIPAISVSRKKSRWKKFLKKINCEEVFSDEENYASKLRKHKETEPTFCEEVLQNEPMLDSFVNNNGDSDTSDCDKDPDIRFLTPTMFKSDYAEQNPAPQVTMLSDYESHCSSITINPSNSQDTDPLFIPHQVKVSAMPSKKRFISGSKSPRQTKSLKTSLKNDKDPVNPTQMSLRRFGFAADNTRNKNPTYQNTGAIKAKFKLFNNKIVASYSNESSLFQKNIRSKKKNPKEKFENLGNKRRCTECKKTFKTPTELKKHVFIEHTIEDLSD